MCTVVFTKYILCTVADRAISRLRTVITVRRYLVSLAFRLGDANDELATGQRHTLVQWSSSVLCSLTANHRVPAAKSGFGVVGCFRKGTAIIFEKCNTNRTGSSSARGPPLVRCQLWQVSETGYLGLGENRCTARVIWRIDIEIDMGWSKAHVTFKRAVPFGAATTNSLRVAKMKRAVEMLFFGESPPM